ncbi:hypothetical protein XM47_01765 [Catenovulum maritimum]|uniref:3-keto-alpha-glucoside-1,2-lyase/3-keto-2-hydroxy-glucal hydratase domain-containing protein n=2 Tax=Catenovulum maritimum TaxID=1513271 RepID=A0A0J8GW75_9ALTE|nr:hypothetical protein XM47_01765 [Catenovulum maritimum]
MEKLWFHGDPADAIGQKNLKDVFTINNDSGEPVLNVTGEIYGGISTKAHYQNYHLSLQVKWGDKKWEPRLNALRDSGLLFHCQGEHGAFWRTWKLCHEYQIQETDLGDYIPLGNDSGYLKGKIRSRDPIPNSAEHQQRSVYDPAGKLGYVGYASASPVVDKPHGEWNTLELFTYGDRAVFVANGEVVMVVQDMQDTKGNPLTSGQIQLQSEGAELSFRDIKIKNLTQMPTKFSRYF